jgi:hypothetical protein
MTSPKDPTLDERSRAGFAVSGSDPDLQYNSWAGESQTKRILLLAVILLAASVSARAQDEYRRFKLAGMFDTLRTDTDTPVN